MARAGAESTRSSHGTLDSVSFLGMRKRSGSAVSGISIAEMETRPQKLLDPDVTTGSCKVGQGSTDSKGRCHSYSFHFLAPQSINSALETTLDAVAFGVLGYVEWLALLQVYPTTYWHLLNAMNLGFNINCAIGILLAFLAIPILTFLTRIWDRYLIRRNKLLLHFAVITLFFLSLQIDQFTRTVFTALAAGCVFLRFFMLQPVFQVLSISFGFLINFIVRWTFASICPLDIADYPVAPAIFFFGGVIALHRAAAHTYKTHCQVHPLLETVHKDTSGGVENSPRLGSLSFTAAYIACAFGLPSILFFGSYFFASESLLVRWNTMQSYNQGPYLVVALSISFAITILLQGHHLKKRTKIFAHATLLGVFALGCLFMILLRGMLAGFVLSIFPAICFLPILTLFIRATQAVLAYLTSSPSWVAVSWLSIGAATGLVAINGMILTYYYVAHLSWFAGPMVPLIGRVFANRVVAVVGPPIAMICLAMIAILTIDLVGAVPLAHQTYESQSRGEAGWAESPNIDPIGNSTPSQRTTCGYLLALAALFLGVFLPGLRWRTWRNSHRGAWDRSTHFTAVTWNIQEALSLGRYPRGAGYLSLEAEASILRDLKAHAVAFQETDASHLLHANRDILAYLAEALGMFDYYGPPSHLSSPGVGILTFEPAVHKQYWHLPLGGGLLFRFMIHTRVAWYDASVKRSAMIDVFNVHLSAFSAAARKIQIGYVKRLMGNGGDSVILMGDFNAPPSNTTELWNDSSSDLKLVKFSNTPMDPNSLPPTQTLGDGHIDHIYYRGLCLRDKKILPTGGWSDHLPVLASFSLPQSDGKCE